MSTMQTIASLPGLLHGVRIIAVASLLFISGLSFCLSEWVVPNMYLVSPTSQLHQFVATFSKGEKLLLPGGRIIMATLVTNTVLTAFHPDIEVSAQWTMWAAIGALMVTAAPYEIVFIFPINDRAKELKKQVDTDRKPLTSKQEKEVRELLPKWAARNYVRVILPLVAGLISLSIL